MKKVDFGLTSDDYAKHRAGFPKEFFTRIAQHNVGKRGQKILDIGTGTGTVARGFAKQGACVTGLDLSPELIEKAKLLDKQANVQVDYIVGKAEDMNFAQQSFDCITAGQCWHWFDRKTVIAKIKELLKDNGKLIIAHFDWIPIANNVVEKTEQLILQYNPNWKMHSGTGVYPEWYKDVAGAGFTNIESYTFDLFVPYTHEQWRGRIRASAGVGASLPPQEVEKFDAQLATILSEQFPKDPLQVHHRVFTLLACKQI